MGDSLTEQCRHVACMEDVLDIYQQPYDADYPVICMDEKHYQLLGEKRHSIPMKRGRPKREDDEYVRNDTCCIFCSRKRYQDGGMSNHKNIGPRLIGHTRFAAS